MKAIGPLFPDTDHRQRIVSSMLSSSPIDFPMVRSEERIDLPSLTIPDFPVPEPPPTVVPQAPPQLSPITLFFFFDSFIRRPESNPSFDLVLSTLQNIPRLRVHLIGDASLEGLESYNLQLGQRRADAIRDELVRLGIDKSRITTFSMGEVFSRRS